MPSECRLQPSHAVMNSTTRVKITARAAGTKDRRRSVSTTSAVWRAGSQVVRRRHRAFETTFHPSRWAAGTYSAQQESLAGSLNLEIATIFSASAIAGNTWSRSMKSGIVARYFKAIAAS